MRTFAAQLLEKLNEEVELHSRNTHSYLDNAELLINATVDVLEKLKSFAFKYSFSLAEEMLFFKQIKPQFVSRLIYYQDLYYLELNKPFGGRKDVKKYYQHALNKLKMYAEYNSDFYKYLRSGSDYLDEKYFVRGQYDIRLAPDNFFFQSDSRFSTSHDFKVARILANDLLQAYLQKEIDKLSSKSVYAITERQVQKWTGSKVALIELIYALHAEGVINNGMTDLKETAKFFEEAFDIDLGQFHRTFFEMRARKSERTKFLNSLRDTLVRRMDEVDE